jgi:hypothetical protein
MTDSDFERYQEGISIKSKMNRFYLSVNPLKEEILSMKKPHLDYFMSFDGDWLVLPKGTIKSILGHKMNYGDNPVEVELHFTENNK